MKNNFCIIMAGGVGSRFWPFSRTERPKQFLDFFGTGRTLLQMTFDRFRTVVPPENVLVVTNVIYKELVLEQLPEIQEQQVLLEPNRRNTAPCIAYATNRIKAINKDANIVVAASDHLILNENAFIDTIKNAIEFVSKNDCLLTLGMKPTRPETGYGYIQMADGDNALRKVKAFTEKPNLEMAKVFVESGEFMWNSGMFIWNLKTIDAAFHEHLPEMAAKFDQGEGLFNTPEERGFIDAMFPSCQNISIDYGIMEKATNVYVLCADFGWSDLGNWGSLYDLSEKDDKGNVTLKCDTAFYDSEDNVVAIAGDKLAVISDLSGYIVAESDNVLMICKRENEQAIRQYVNDAQVKFEGKYN